MQKSTKGYLLIVIIIIIALTAWVTYYSYHRYQVSLLPPTVNNPLPKLNASKDTPFYSNLADESSLNQVIEILATTDLPAENITTFKKQVEYYYKIVGVDQMIKNWTTLSPPTYDPYLLQDKWQAEHQYPGYNCRLTTFTLMQNYWRINNPQDRTSDYLIFDYLTLEENMTDQQTLVNFNNLFPVFDTNESTSASQQAEVITTGLRQQKTYFPEGNVKLIRVFLHNNITFNKNDFLLFTGHAGILIEQPQQYLFIEKLSFSDPYQAIIFHSLEQLRAYLLKQYDTSTQEPVSPPIITINNDILSPSTIEIN